MSSTNSDALWGDAIRGRMALRGSLDLEGLRGPVVAGAAALVAALVLTTHGRVLGLFVAAIMVVVAVSLKPHVFLAGALVVVGLSIILDPYALHLGPATVYPTDIVVGLAILRALRPAERLPAARAVGLGLALTTGIWAVVMLIAGLRALNVGESLDTVVRYETALLYFPALIFSFSRIPREKPLSFPRLWQLLALVSVGFVFWMFVMRILNHPFE